MYNWLVRIDPLSVLIAVIVGSVTFGVWWMLTKSRVFRQASPRAFHRANELNVTNLSYELRTVVSKWYQLGTRLGIPTCELSIIEEDKSNAERRMMETLSLWLRYAPMASWNDVVIALQEMGENTVAERIHSKYIGGAIRSVQEDSGAVAIARRNLLEIEWKFGVLHMNACKKLREKKTIDITDFRECLKQLVPEESIPRSSNIEEILDAIRHQKIWNYWNYSLLEKVVTQFVGDDQEMKSLIKTYKEDLAAYKETQVLIHYIALRGHQSTHYEYNREYYWELTIVVETKFSDHTLKHIENLWKEFADLYNLPPHAALLKYIRRGSVSIIWLIPSYLAYIIHDASPSSVDFYRKYQITRVEFDGEYIYQEVEEQVEAAPLHMPTKEHHEDMENGADVSIKNQKGTSAPTTPETEGGTQTGKLWEEVAMGTVQSATSEMDTAVSYEMSREGALIGVIDQSTSNSHFLLFNEKCQLVSPKHRYQVDVHPLLPKEGWFEQDPCELVGSVWECLEKAGEGLQAGEVERLKGIGITNQRETTILWDRTTGKPLHNAIVWCDTRAAEIVDRMVEKSKKEEKDLQDLCGLPIHTYFSALKVIWLMENNEAVKTAMKEENCLFGTVDTWIIWNLTGGVNGGKHVTDVTNASRTMLMNIRTLQWDPELCRFFGIPQDILPIIGSSADSEFYGTIAKGKFKGVPICGCLGDQQAALVGEQCFFPGDAKITDGHGCFLLYNTGQKPLMSKHGLLTTVAFQLGPKEKPTYALEGVSIGGDIVRWLEDNLNISEVQKSTIEEIARSVPDTADVYFVPASSGLYAPYWQLDAQGLIIGLTEKTNKAHLCRATLEAVCFQSREILDAIKKDCPERPPASLRVDGGMTVNDLLLQLQANFLGIPVVRPDFPEILALGAAIAVGMAKEMWKIVDGFPVLPEPPTTEFKPKISPDKCDARCARWKEAVKHSMHWQHTSRSPPDKPQLRDLVDALYHKVADKWKMIGVLVEIPRGTLAGIAEKCHCDPHKCLLEMLKTWLEQIHPPASWATIIEAVEFLDEEQLGRKLRDKYIT